MIRGVRPMTGEFCQEKLDELFQACRVHGLPMTIQRRTVMETLAGREDHPGAEEVFEEARHRVPGLSRTTVYRVLETMVQLGVAARVAHLGSQTRFDAQTSPHPHAICVKCGRVVNFEPSTALELMIPSESNGFQLTGYQVVVHGICPRCR